MNSNINTMKESQIETLNANGECGLVNCAPHALTIHTTNGGTYVLPKSGICPRVSEVSEPIGGLSPDGIVNIEIVSTTFGEVEGLPEPQQDTYYVVSAMVKSACPERTDLLSPGPLVRDEEGNPIGCQGLRS